MVNWQERRKYPRVPISVLARVEYDKGVRYYYSKNISAGGIFLMSDSPLDVETMLSLEIFLPLSNLPVKAKGEVVWLQRQEPTGFAVKFTKISDEARELVRWVVKQYLVPSKT